MDRAEQKYDLSHKIDKHLALFCAFSLIKLKFRMVSISTNILPFLDKFFSKNFQLCIHIYFIFTDVNPIAWIFCLFVLNVPSTARSFRQGTPIYCPLRRRWSSVNTPYPPGIKLLAVAWQYTAWIKSLLLPNWWFIHTWVKVYEITKTENSLKARN